MQVRSLANFVGFFLVALYMHEMDYVFETFILVFFVFTPAPSENWVGIVVFTGFRILCEIVFAFWV